MTKLVWNKGAPPHVGWWEASMFRNKDVWRWWNGSCWSILAYKFTSPSRVKAIAERQAGMPSDEIEWCDYYSPNARVSRIDPRKGAAMEGKPK